MSTYIEVLNRIKNNYSRDWLTSSQNEVFNKLLAFLEPPYYVIDIFGAKGVGKTFLGWVLQSEGIGVYAPCIDYFNCIKSQKCIIIDNCSHDRNFVRDLRNTIKEYNLERIILLTNEKVEDSIPSFELKNTLNDVKTFKNNLSRIDVKTREIESLNLWDYITTAEV